MTEVKYNLTKENKNQWNDLGFNTDACNIVGVGTFNWHDHFVDDNFGSVIHDTLKIQIYERKDLGADVTINIDFGFDYKSNNELLLLIKKMFDLGLLYEEELEDGKKS